jgi:hypothetical protein
LRQRARHDTPRAARETPPGLAIDWGASGSINETPRALRRFQRYVHGDGDLSFPTDLKQSFEDNLFATFGVSADSVQSDVRIQAWDPIYPEYEMGKVVKIILPRPIHGAAMYDLHTMNVNAVSLFDGLEGLADRYRRFLWLIDPEA